MSPFFTVGVNTTILNMKLYCPPLNILHIIYCGNFFLLKIIQITTSRYVSTTHKYEVLIQIWGKNHIQSKSVFEQTSYCIQIDNIVIYPFNLQQT